MSYSINQKYLILVLPILFLGDAVAQSSSSLRVSSPIHDEKQWDDALTDALQTRSLDPKWADMAPIPQDMRLDAAEVLVTAPPVKRSARPVPAARRAPSQQPQQPRQPQKVQPIRIAGTPTPAIHPDDTSSSEMTFGATVQSPSLASPHTMLNLVPGNARLASALVEFARANGWEIAWEIERDFPIDYPARFEGPFLDIIRSVLGALHTTDAPIRAKIYHANKVVRIIPATR